jgi:hypothetical protein
MSKQPVFGGYTDDELRDAFELVRPAENWKLPIDATVPEGTDTDVILAAVCYFTGGPAFFEANGDGTIHVTGAGYYAQVGA